MYHKWRPGGDAEEDGYLDGRAGNAAGGERLWFAAGREHDDAVTTFPTRVYVLGEQGPICIWTLTYSQQPA